MNENEIFKVIENNEGYYLSNFKRVYSTKSKQFLKLYDNNTWFRGSNRHKVIIKSLFEKYFNQPDELNLIAIIKYGNYKFQNYYYDILDDKFYCFKNGIYNEIKQHNDKRRKNSINIRFNDINGRIIKLSKKKFKKLNHIE